MKQLTIFDFIDEPKEEIAPVVRELDADESWCKERGISILSSNPVQTIEEHSRCTCMLERDIKDIFESFGLNIKKPISYAKFNRWCVNCGIGFREGHAKAERDFEVLKSFEDGYRILRFANRDLPVLCMGAKTFDGYFIGEVV